MVKKFKPRKNPAAWNFPEPEEEIDLHGYVAEEAAAAVENLMEGMKRAGLSVLRIIHGGGNPEEVRLLLLRPQLLRSSLQVDHS